MTDSEVRSLRASSRIRALAGRLAAKDFRFHVVQQLEGRLAILGEPEIALIEDDRFPGPGS